MLYPRGTTYLFVVTLYPWEDERGNLRELEFTVNPLESFAVLITLGILLMFLF